MKEKSIPIHKEYGLNPSIICCAICGKELGIALLGRTIKEQAPMKCCTGDICDDCKEHLKTQNVILEFDTNKNQPTGRHVWVDTDCIAEHRRNDKILFMPTRDFVETFVGDDRENIEKD